MTLVIQNIIDALSLGSIYALTALGIGMIFSVMRLVNFAHGDYISFCAFSMLAPVVGGPPQVFLGAMPAILLVPTVLIVGILIAVVSEVALFRRLRGASPATFLIAAFGLGMAIQSGLLMVYSSRPIALNLWPSLSHPIEFMGLRIPILQFVVIGVTAIALLALALFLRHTRLGTAMRASAENFAMAQMLGIPANRVIMVAFGISGALAAMTCLLLLPQTGIADIRMGQSILLLAFVATVIGGLGSLGGAVAGGFLLGFVSVALQVLLPREARPFRDAFVYIFVIFVLLWRPEGIWAPRSHRSRI